MEMRQWPLGDITKGPTAAYAKARVVTWICLGVVEVEVVLGERLQAALVVSEGVVAPRPGGHHTICKGAGTQVGWVSQRERHLLSDRETASELRSYLRAPQSPRRSPQQPSGRSAEETNQVQSGGFL